MGFSKAFPLGNRTPILGAALLGVLSLVRRGFSRVQWAEEKVMVRLRTQIPMERTQEESGILSGICLLDLILFA